MAKYLGSLFLLLFAMHLQAQKKAGVESVYPKVFFIGEEEKKYEKLVENYNKMLFTVCDNNMDLSFQHWTQLLRDIEAYASNQNIDLKGVKLWFNVFWSKSGGIDYIVFHPKPNSKNLNYELIKEMLAGFIEQYQSPIKSSTQFSHYGSASFPVFSMPIGDKVK